jgi:hypothetical protein
MQQVSPPHSLALRFAETQDDHRVAALHDAAVEPSAKCVYHREQLEANVMETLVL